MHSWSTRSDCIFWCRMNRSHTLIFRLMLHMRGGGGSVAVNVANVLGQCSTRSIRLKYPLYDWSAHYHEHRPAILKEGNDFWLCTTCTLRLCVHIFCTSSTPVDRKIKSFLPLLILYYATYQALCFLFELECLLLWDLHLDAFFNHGSFNKLSRASINSWALLGHCVWATILALTNSQSLHLISSETLYLAWDSFNEASQANSITKASTNSRALWLSFNNHSSFVTKLQQTLELYAWPLTPTQ